MQLKLGIHSIKFIYPFTILLICGKLDGLLNTKDCFDSSNFRANAVFSTTKK